MGSLPRRQRVGAYAVMLRERDGHVELLLSRLRRPDGRWQRSWQADGGARHDALAGDHAALVEAFVALAQATGEARWIDEARAVAGADVLCAGVAAGPDGALVTAGGRVLNVVGTGADGAEARARAYEALGHISWPGMHHRADIAAG